MQNNNLQVGERTVALDLATALQGDEGTFLCQQGGQSYIAVAQHGHSITHLKPVGRRFIEAAPVSMLQESWTIEKISNTPFAESEQLLRESRR